MAETEQAIQLAIADFTSGVFPSIRATARAHHLPESTLRSRINGGRSRRTAHEFQQRLTSAQEEFLVDWILEEDAQGRAPSHARTREMAARVLKMVNDTKPLGQNWLSGFLQRNPRVAVCIGRPLASTRAHGATQEALQDLYTTLQRVIQTYNIPPEAIYNMDEHGIALGACDGAPAAARMRKAETSCMRAKQAGVQQAAVNRHT
jgi:hypothetical protein